MDNQLAFGGIQQATPDFSSKYSFELERPSYRHPQARIVANMLLKDANIAVKIVIP